ncbi:MAG: GatB/YqeY domain-containing protein, partial [Mesorhizobium sp.]
MRGKIAESLKSAMKAQDKRRLPTLRLIQAAIHD